MRRTNPRPRAAGRDAASTALMALALLVTCSASGSAQAAPAAPAAAPAPTAAPAAPVAVVDNDPGQLIDSAAKAMLADLDANRAEYRKDPTKIRALVDRVLLPHFDTEYSGRLVLGKHWTTATAEQRQHFVAAFYHSLLNNYGTALLDFTGERLKVFPYKGEPGATNATVRTMVRKDDGNTVAVNYSLHRTDKGWMAWDVIIEGISYVKSFRDDFSSEIEQKGMDALITRLEAQNAHK